MKTGILAAVALVATAGCVQAQSGPTTSFDGLAGSRTVDTDGNVEMNGAAVSLSGRVGGWVEMNGGAVDVNATIGGELEVNGGAVDIAGNVGGRTLINGGAVDLQGAFEGPVELNAGAADVNGEFDNGLTARVGAMEFNGIARGQFEVFGSGRDRNWRGRPRADRSEVEINGSLPAGATICAHEVRFGRDAEFAGPVTVIADSEPEFANGVSSSDVRFENRNGESCD